MATTVAFRTLDDAGKLPDNYVNPYYLEDLKRRVSVARAGGKLYAFDPRPALGSGYNRLKPVMPHKPMVPQRTSAELRLDARKEDVIRSIRTDL
jgi:hypothetical protein